MESQLIQADMAEEETEGTWTCQNVSAMELPQLIRLVSATHIHMILHITCILLSCSVLKVGGRNYVTR